ncbi:hypothetical protein BJX68DRAFT_226273 [Aspergillus pseudodeflectus]|uniref:Uncharacterized protein n=1 Tax=Aspergillus pseudodeflectus TaxID=176178 RepID=A0ABR4L516_9EURO
MSPGLGDCGGKRAGIGEIERKGKPWLIYLARKVSRGARMEQRHSDDPDGAMTECVLTVISFGATTACLVPGATLSCTLLGPRRVTDL